MRFDPLNDPFQDLNDPAVLDDTPIGTLRVIPWANAASVAVMDDTDITIPRRIIMTLHEKQNPLDAVYGKRAHESADWLKAYEQRDENDARSATSEDNDRSKDLVSDLDKLERRKDDGAEAVAAAIGLVPWEVKG